MEAPLGCRRCFPTECIPLWNIILHRRTSSTGGPPLQKTLCNSGAPPMPELKLRPLHGEFDVPQHVAGHASDDRLELRAVDIHLQLVCDLPLVAVGDGDARAGNRRPGGGVMLFASSTFKLSGITPEESLTVCSWRPRRSTRRSTWRSCPPATLGYIIFSQI